jgi:hypothetical protein
MRLRITFLILYPRERGTEYFGHIKDDIFLIHLSVCYLLDKGSADHSSCTVKETKYLRPLKRRNHGLESL